MKGMAPLVLIGALLLAGCHHAARQRSGRAGVRDVADTWPYLLIAVLVRRLRS